ncbi:MAG: glycosyltransferase family A protein [Alistipes sp.]
MNCNFSVIIPLYNKEAEIRDTVLSVLAQTYQPMEIVIVDDGSTDCSAEIVRSIHSPLVKLISQPNAGECAARNRAMDESTGDYMALVDADDTWEPGFLAEIASMIEEFPDCGIYSTAFNIVSHEGVFPSNSPSERGVVANFFRDSMTRYISIPSASVIPKCVIDRIGGFPEGMKLGGDQYMWIKIARRYAVCFSPYRLSNYSKVASNRSSAIYTPERTHYTFEDLYDREASSESNEFVARAALGKALVISAKGGTKEARQTARFFAWTRDNRRTLRKVRVLNRLPVCWRSPLLNLYNRLAWAILKKGL